MSIPLPRRGGTYLICPLCKRRAGRTVHQYARHYARRHPVIGQWGGMSFHAPARIYTAPSGTSETDASRWTLLGTVAETRAYIPRVLSSHVREVDRRCPQLAAPIPTFKVTTGPQCR